jgi:hypothetical protein
MTGHALMIVSHWIRLWNMEQFLYHPMAHHCESRCPRDIIRWRVRGACQGIAAGDEFIRVVEGSEA